MGKILTDQQGRAIVVNGNVFEISSAVDDNIQPQNIKSGVNILGVNGNYTGDSVQSDWDENDSNNPAFIKNKPNLSGLYAKPSGGIPSTDLTQEVQISLGKADSALQSHQDISGKADKVSGATNGNFAGLDSNGNLVDSGCKASDFLTQHQDITGKEDKSNKVISWQSTPDDTHYPSEKLVNDTFIKVHYHQVTLNTDGSIRSKGNTLTYAGVKANISNSLETDYLDVLWDNGDDTNTNIQLPCLGITEAQSGDILFGSNVYFNGIQLFITLVLDSQDNLTKKPLLNWEPTTNKVTTAVLSPSNQTFPTTLAIFNEFQRKPAVVWETDSVGLTALGTDMSASPAWQLTNLDFSPFKRVKIYTKAAQKSGTTASASTTPAIILEMSLDARAAGPYGGHYLASTVIQKSNDSNRLATLCCAISADKTSFAVMRMTNLYGTAATDNSDIGGYVFKIEGYYD